MAVLDIITEGQFGTQELVFGAKRECDKEDDPSISFANWVRYLNDARKALFRKLAAQFADSWITTVDFTIAAGSNTYAFGATFDQLRKLTKDPGTSARRTIHPFNLQDADDLRGGDPKRRMMGRTLYLEPPESAPGNYRAWYVPRPSTFFFAFDAAVATTGALPSYVAAGGPGAGKTLTASANGLLSADTVDAEAGALWIVRNQTNAIDNGLYVVTTPGDGSTKFVLTLLDVTDGAYHAAGGHANLDKVYTASVTTLGVTAFSWTLQVLDEVETPYVEWIEVYAAAKALEAESSDSSVQRQRLADLEEDMLAVTSQQEAGGMTAIADVEEFDDMHARRHPLP